MRLVVPSAPSSISIGGGVTNDPYPTYSGATTYALGARVLSTTGPFASNVYESLVASNVGNAVTLTTKWVFVSADNPYRMFDQVANSQTTGTGYIEAQFNTTPLANTVALLNVRGATASVQVLSGGSSFYLRTQSLIVAGGGVIDWYTYFFGGMTRLTDVLFADLPTYAGQTLIVTVTDTGNPVAIGTLAVGFGYNIGDTLYGARIGINDYSRKVADAFGQFQVVQRTYSKRGSFTLRIPNSRVDEIANLLPQYRATPAVWIGSDSYGSTFIYGFYKSYDVTIQYVSHSAVTIEIEGLS